MTAALLVYAAVAGVAIVEGLRRAFGRIGPKRRLAQLQATLREFQAAGDDDARQQLMLQAGLRTLALSLLLFATFALACIVMLLPLPWIPMTGMLVTAYSVVLTVAAIAWWLRRSGR